VLVLYCVINHSYSYNIIIPVSRIIIFYTTVRVVYRTVLCTRSNSFHQLGLQAPARTTGSFAPLLSFWYNAYIRCMVCLALRSRITSLHYTPYLRHLWRADLVNGRSILTVFFLGLRRKKTFLSPLDPNGCGGWICRFPTSPMEITGAFCYCHVENDTSVNGVWSPGL